MPSLDHPADRSPEQRRQEIAAILAAGVLRYRQYRRRAEPAVPLPFARANSDSRRLELSPETVLSVLSGLTVPESSRNGRQPC
jgi:hypothetical protein